MYTCIYYVCAYLYCTTETVSLNHLISYQITYQIIYQTEICFSLIYILYVTLHALCKRDNKVAFAVGLVKNCKFFCWLRNKVVFCIYKQQSRRVTRGGRRGGIPSSFSKFKEKCPDFG